MGDEIYHIIPKINQEVKKELWIQKWTKIPTNDLIHKYLEKQKTPILIYISSSKIFHLKILEYAYINKSCSHSNRYYPFMKILILQKNGEWKFVKLCKICLQFNIYTPEQKYLT